MFTKRASLLCTKIGQADLLYTTRRRPNCIHQGEQSGEEFVEKIKDCQRRLPRSPSILIIIIRFIIYSALYDNK